MILGVGWKKILIVAIVLVAILTSYLTIQYIQEVEKDKITIETLEQTQEKREKIRDTIENNKPLDRGDSGDSLQWLKSRQGSEPKNK